MSIVNALAEQAFNKKIDVELLVDHYGISDYIQTNIQRAGCTVKYVYGTTTGIMHGKILFARII